MASDKMRLVTADGKFVANVGPLLPENPTPVAVWGDRIFLQTGESVWTEVRPTVVVQEGTKS